MFEEYKINELTKYTILEGIEYVNKYYESNDIANRDHVIRTLGKALGVLHYIKEELERAERV